MYFVRMRAQSASRNPTSRARLHGTSFPGFMPTASAMAGQMLGQDDKLISPQARDQVCFTFDAKQTLGDPHEYFIANAVSMPIVDLLETVKVQQKEAVDGSRPWRGGNGRLQRFVELSAIRQSRQRILIRQLTRMLLGGHPPLQFPPLLKGASGGEGHGKGSAHQQGFIQFDRALSAFDSVVVGKDVKFVRDETRDGDEHKH